MKIKFMTADESGDLSNIKQNFGLYGPLEQGGRSYTLLGTSEKSYGIARRCWFGIRALAKTLFSLGLGLLSQKTRDDWNSCFSGKKIVAIYVPPDQTRFFSQKILADGGDASAQNNLGIMYANGLDVQKNYDKAREYYERAVAQGDARAQNNLGFMYQSGQGVAQNYDKAIEYYKQAAAQGDADAQYNLGFMYGSGTGVAQDYDKAREYYELAADQSNTDAQNQLGFMYQKGIGVAQNDKKAREYYERAANLGDEYAQKRLNEIDAAT